MADTPDHLFNKTMIVQRSEKTVDEFRAPITQYVDDEDPIKCRLSPLSESEISRYQKLNNEETASVYTYPDLVLSPSDRVVIENKIYRILGLHVDSMKVLLRIDCEVTPNDI